MAIDMVAAETRLQFYADTIGVPAPRYLLCETNGVAAELIEFCDKYGASLDWIFLGDLRGMIRDSFELQKMRAQSQG